MFKWIKENKVLSTVVVAAVAVAGVVAYAFASDELPEELAELVEEVTEANA
jgi:hypothetical protein